MTRTFRINPNTKRIDILVNTDFEPLTERQVMNILVDAFTRIPTIKFEWALTGVRTTTITVKAFDIVLKTINAEDLSKFKKIQDVVDTINSIIVDIKNSHDRLNISEHTIVSY